MSVRKPSVIRHPRDISAELIAQLEILAGDDCCVELIRERPWASITFSGTRHRFAIDCAKSGASCKEQLSAQLNKQEFILTGHFVADVLICEPAISDTGLTIWLEILTIIDPVVPQQ